MSHEELRTGIPEKDRRSLLPPDFGSTQDMTKPHHQLSFVHRYLGTPVETINNGIRGRKNVLSDDDLFFLFGTTDAEAIKSSDRLAQIYTNILKFYGRGQEGWRTGVRDENGQLIPAITGYTTELPTDSLLDPTAA